MTINNPQIIKFAEQHILQHPESFVIKMQYENQTYWIKRRPFSKKRVWHRLQRLIANLTGLPIFYPTVCSGGPESLLYEAERLRQFAEKGIQVPEVLAVTESFIVTKDAGCQLSQYLRSLTDTTELKTILHQATRTLACMHKAGLCHARPSMKDMTFKDETIYLIDLEEDPLSVMDLNQAQARDIWLFLLGAIRYCREDEWVSDLFQTYCETVLQDIPEALSIMVRKLAPFLRAAESVNRWIPGRDVSLAIRTNRVLEKCLNEACTGTIAI